MQENSKVHFMPPVPKREKRVGIYCRVSTNSTDQLQSLIAQIAHRCNRRPNLKYLSMLINQINLGGLYCDRNI